VKIKELKLTQFRNYKQIDLVFDAKFIALVGMNGMGKTNVLDAIYYTCIGKSYFNSLDRHVIMQGESFFRIETVIDEGEFNEIVVVKSQESTKKEIEISGKKLSKLSDHVGRFLCVIIAPSDIHSMLEGSEERRNYLNHTISQTSRAYLDDLIIYNQLLKHRNSVLKNFAERKTFDPLLLQSISQGMYIPAQRIYNARMEVMEAMNLQFTKVYQQLSGQAEECHIEYQSDLEHGNLEHLMQNSIDKDRILGRTSRGIHKDDLIFKMNGELLKNYASQGQLKSFVMALKLTQYHILQRTNHKKPILLLDDIFDKLDQNRVKHLLKILMEDEFGQIFITDTNENRIVTILKEIKAQFRTFVVEKGQINYQDGAT
jgi:DNA replication and repair protein RecF